MQLSLLELVSLHFGRTCLTSRRHGLCRGQDDAGAYQCLVGGADAGGAELVDAMDRKFMTVPEHAKKHTKDADILDDILTALNFVRIQWGALYARVGGQCGRTGFTRTLARRWRQGIPLCAGCRPEGESEPMPLTDFEPSRVRGRDIAYPEDFAIRSHWWPIALGSSAVKSRTFASHSPAKGSRAGPIWHRSQRVEPRRWLDRVDHAGGNQSRTEAWLLGWSQHVGARASASGANCRLHAEVSRA